MRADRRHPACVFVISVGLLAIFTLSLGLTSSAANGPGAGHHHYGAQRSVGGRHSGSPERDQ